MSFKQLSTLTSGVLAIADTKLIGNREVINLNLVNSHHQNIENILVIDKNYNDINNHDLLIDSIFDMGFRVVISDTFTNIFSTKAINKGILPIQMSRSFIDNIIARSKAGNIKLFIDLIGQEAMIVNSGEKEFFALSDYCKENFETGIDDAEQLYSVWEDLNISYKKEEVLDYAIE